MGSKQQFLNDLNALRADVASLKQIRVDLEESMTKMTQEMDTLRSEAASTGEQLQDLQSQEDLLQREIGHLTASAGNIDENHAQLGSLVVSRRDIEAKLAEQVANAKKLRLFLLSEVKARVALEKKMEQH